MLNGFKHVDLTKAAQSPAMQKEREKSERDRQQEVKKYKFLESKKNTKI